VSKSVTRGGRQITNNVGEGTTSDIGEYRVPDLPPGRYLVATAPRNNRMNTGPTPAGDPLPTNAEMAYAATYYPSTPDANAAIPVDGGYGTEMRGIDIRLVKTRVFRVRGKVTGLPANGGPGRGGMVPVMLTARDGSPGQPRVSMGQGRGPDGLFE